MFDGDSPWTWDRILQITTRNLKHIFLLTFGVKLGQADWLVAIGSAIIYLALSNGTDILFWTAHDSKDKFTRQRIEESVEEIVNGED